VHRHAQPTKTDQHTLFPIRRQLQALGHQRGIDTGCGTGEAQIHAGEIPIHGQRKGATQQQVALAIAVEGQIRPGNKGPTKGAIDGIPAETCQPDQWTVEALRQQSRTRRHIREDQGGRVLGGQPGGFGLHLGG
ncbi:MAG: hypothetical protein ACK559_05225, partial [bacterium]